MTSLRRAARRDMGPQGSGETPKSAVVAHSDAETAALAKRLNRIETCRAPRRIECCKERQGQRKHDHEHDLAGIHLRRNAAQEVNCGVKKRGSRER